MLKFGMFIIAAALALPAAPAVAQDGPTASIQRLTTTVKLKRPVQCGGIFSRKMCDTRTRKGHVSVDQGAGFKTASSWMSLEVGDKVRIRQPAIVVLTYPSGCVKTLRRNGVYVVQACNEDEDDDDDEDPDQDDSEDSEDSENSEDSDLDSRDSTQGTGDTSLLNVRNALYTGTTYVVGKEVYDQLQDDKKGDPVSP